MVRSVPSARTTGAGGQGNHTLQLQCVAVAPQTFDRCGCLVCAYMTGPPICLGVKQTSLHAAPVQHGGVTQRELPSSAGASAAGPMAASFNQEGGRGVVCGACWVPIALLLVSGGASVGWRPMPRQKVRRDVQVAGNAIPACGFADRQGRTSRASWPTDARERLLPQQTCPLPGLQALHQQPRPACPLHLAALLQALLRRPLLLAWLCRRR